MGLSVSLTGSRHQSASGRDHVIDLVQFLSGLPYVQRLIEK